LGIICFSGIRAWFSIWTFVWRRYIEWDYMAMGLSDQVRKWMLWTGELRGKANIGSLPLGAITILLLFVFMPVGFPDIKAKKQKRSIQNFREIDYLGTLLIFSGSAFIVSALEEAGPTYAWSSGCIIALLVLAALCMLSFLVWKYIGEKRMKSLQPVFTWRLMTYCSFVGALM
jgi:hypothetical protein